MVLFAERFLLCAHGIFASNLTNTGLQLICGDCLDVEDPAHCGRHYPLGWGFWEVLSHFKAKWWWAGHSRIVDQNIGLVEFGWRRGTHVNTPRGFHLLKFMTSYAIHDIMCHFTVTASVQRLSHYAVKHYHRPSPEPFPPQAHVVSPPYFEPHSPLCVWIQLSRCFLWVENYSVCSTKDAFYEAWYPQSLPTGGMHHLPFFSIKIKTGKINRIRSCIYWSVLGLLMPFGCCEWFGMSTCADVPVGSAYREGVEFLCRMVILFLMFWGLCFPRGHITLTLPALAVRGFQIFTTSPAHYRVVVEDRRQNFFLGIWKCFLWKHGQSSQSQPLAMPVGNTVVILYLHSLPIVLVNRGW